MHVLYVADVDGMVSKYTLLPRTRETCLVETIDPFRPSNDVRRTIHTMQFLKYTVRIKILFKKLISHCKKISK